MKTSGEPLTFNDEQREKAPFTFDGTLPEGRVVGTVRAVKFEHGFAFVRVPGLPDAFAQIRRFRDFEAGTSRTFDMLQPGDRLSCFLVKTSRGLRALDVEAA